MAHKLHFFVFTLLFQLSTQAFAGSVSQKYPQTLFHPSSGQESLDSEQLLDDAPGFSMQQCLEQCKRRHQMAAMGLEAIMTECRRQCEKKQALQLIQSSDLEKKSRGIHQFCLLAEKNDVPELLVLLEEDLNKRSGVWAEIIPTLGRLKDARAVPLLSDLLQFDDEDWLGREMAAQALGEISDSRAVPVLMQAAWRAETRDTAIAALAQISDVRAASVLVSAIQPEEDLETQKNAAKGLIRLGSDAVAAITQELNNYSQEDRQQQKRVWLCQILGAMKNAQADSVILKLVKDPDPAVRACAQKILKKRE